MTILIIVSVLLLLLMLSWRGRSGHGGMEDLRGWAYAHRGLHGNGLPENSIPAFRAAVEHGYGMELDVHLMKDGNLAVIHDSLLFRTTGLKGKIEDLTAAQLCEYRLENTDACIPEFSEVLELVDGKVPLIVELKPVDNNYAALTARACEVLSQYRGAYCIESFDPRCILWLRKNRPEIIRGQLSENFLGNQKSGLPFLLRLIMTCQLGNFLSRPDFIAYKYGDRKRLSVWFCRKIWGIQGVSWTLKNKSDFDTAVKEGWLPIFEGIRPK